jgi:hypothetical protein
MPWPVHRHPVGSEPGNPVIFRGFIKKIPPGGMVKHPAKVPYPNVVCPRHRYVNPIYHILPAFRIKMTIVHTQFLHITHLQDTPGIGGNPTFKNEKKYPAFSEKLREF